MGRRPDYNVLVPVNSLSSSRTRWYRVGVAWRDEEKGTISLDIELQTVPIPTTILLAPVKDTKNGKPDETEDKGPF